MVTLQYRKYKFYLPENFNELTGKQLISINELLLLNVPKYIVRLKLLQVLLGLRSLAFFMLPVDLKQRMLFYTKPAEDFNVNDDETESSIDWLFTKNSLTTQLIPCYNGFYGPKTEFDNLRVKEFHVAELAYEEYIKTEAEDALNKLVAVLYRPCKNGYDHKLDYDGDARIIFNPNTLPHFTSIVSKWPVAVRVSIFQWYDGCREYIKDLYDVFNGTGSGEGEPGMYDIIRQLSGTKYGTFKEVEDMLLHDILKEIESSIADNERMEREIEKQKV